MTRSKKVRRFFQGKDREAKVIQRAYDNASLQTLLSGSKYLSMQGHPLITQYRGRVDLLQRQIFILDNPLLPFEIEKTKFHFQTGGSVHYLYRVVLAEEEEVLYQLTWSGRKGR